MIKEKGKGGVAAKQGGSAANQSGSATNQGGSDANQSGSASNQGGSAANQSVNASNQGGSDANQSGSASNQSGSEANQSGSEANQSGTHTSSKANASDKTAELERMVEEMQSKYLLLSADFDNYRKRMLKERTDLLKSAGEDMLKELLPIMDNFERALKSMESAKDIPSLREGVELIFADFKSFFNREGVKEIECLGKAFSTDEQEAVARIPATKPSDKGMVLECVQKGYKLNDKVIRYARVVVGD